MSVTAASDSSSWQISPIMRRRWMPTSCERMERATTSPIRSREGQPAHSGRGGGSASRLHDVATQALDVFAHLFVGPSLREPAVSEVCSTAQRCICSSTHPDRNGTSYGKGVKPGFGDGMKLAFVGDDFLTPEE